MKRVRLRKAVVTSFLVSLVFQWVVPAFAIGLRTRFGDVTVENLCIGNSYSMRKLVKLPLRVFNDSDRAVELRIDPVFPGPLELKADYTPIPELSWISLERESFKIGPRMYGETDVSINIPDDEQYLGRKYQVFIWSRTVGNSIGLGLKSRLLFTIAPEECDTSPDVEGHGDFEFTVSPSKIIIHGVQPGEVFDIQKEIGATLKVCNTGKETKRFKVESVAAEDDLVDAGEGYQPCPLPAFLTLEAAPEFELKPGETSEIKMYLNLPNDDRYVNKNYLFLVRTSQEGASFLTHVYVSTER